MKILIRYYQPEDYDERQALAILCESVADSNIGLGKPEHPPDLLTINLIAMAENRMVGFLDGDQAMAPDETGKVIPVVPPEGYIHCIGVHPAYARHGIGRRLLFAAFKEYEKAGYSRVELGAANPTVARFYIACGGQIRDPLYPGNFEWRLPSDEFQ